MDTQDTKTIDMTPTWAGILPALLAVLQDGTEEGKRTVREELARMAQAADKWNEIVGAAKQAVGADLSDLSPSDKETALYAVAQQVRREFGFDH